MEVKELIIGKYYKVMLDYDHNKFFIAKLNGSLDKSGNAPAYYISNMNWDDLYVYNDNGNPCFISYSRIAYDASDLEISWLEACVKANKFIPLEKTELNQEIFQIW
jgi:hypothetical protein